MSSNTGVAKIKFEVKLGAATREAFGRELAELGRENQDIVVCDADLSKSTMTTYFAKEFPERFFSCGIAESNMVGIAAGLALAGKIPFVSSFSAFVMTKGFEQLRVCAAYPKVNVKVVGTHSGISIGEDGPSQMSVEDTALACALPGFVVISPADEVSTKALIRAAAAHVGPVFVRTGRPKAPVIYDARQSFEIGKAIQLVAGSDLTIITNGSAGGPGDPRRASAGVRRHRGARGGHAHGETARSRCYRARGGRNRGYRGGRGAPGRYRPGRARGAGGGGNPPVPHGVRGHPGYVRRIGPSPMS